MKRILLIMVILMLSSIFLSCQKEATNEVENKSLKVVSLDDGRVAYTIEDNDEAIPDHLLQILGNNIENSGPMETIFLDGIPDLYGEELKIEIYGEIKNFEIIEINLEQDSEGKMIEEIIKRYDEIEVIKNKVIIIDTYFSEGIPSGKIQWENKSGKVFDYYFSQEGHGIDGEIIMSE